jgi:hypothetical protein
LINRHSKHQESANRTQRGFQLWYYWSVALEHQNSLKFQTNGNRLNICAFAQYTDQVTGWTTGVRFSAETTMGFFFFHRIQTDSEGQPASNPMGMAGYFPRSKEKNSQPLPGLEPAIIQPLTQRYTTELSRLQHLITSRVL